MPKDRGYEPDRDAGISSNERAFPKPTEPRGAKRFGPPPRSERPVRQNVYNTDRHGRVQPRGPRS